MQPPEVTPTAILTPGQKNWLFLLLATVVGGLVGRYLPGTPVPSLPAEVLTQVADTAATVKRIEAGQVQVMRAAGVPPP